MRRLIDWFDRNLTGITIAFLIAAMMLIYLAPNIVITVPAGNVGVLWKRFDDGTVTDRYYREGYQFILPWDQLLTYDARVQRVNQDFDVITSNGLTIGANISYRFRINRQWAGLLHKYLGPDYVNTVLSPKVGAIARAEGAKYSPVQIFSTNREDVEKAILDLTRQQVALVTADILATEAEERKARGLPSLDQVMPTEPKNAIHLMDILFRSITLPPLVREAIERKEEQFHVNQEYEYRLDREHKESQRKAVEAKGIQEFQRIINEGITDEYLRWKGIDATLQLALSQNSKIVVIGSGKDGLPLILGPLGNDVPATPPAPPAPANNNAAQNSAAQTDAEASLIDGPPAAQLMGGGASGAGGSGGQATASQSGTGGSASVPSSGTRSSPSLPPTASSNTPSTPATPPGPNQPAPQR